MEIIIEKFSIKQTKKGNDYLLGDAVLDGKNMQFKVWYDVDNMLDQITDHKYFVVEDHDMDDFNGREYITLKKITKIEKDKMTTKVHVDYTPENAFVKELKLIKNPEIKELVKVCLKEAPDYFYTIPASATGKYHPKLSLGRGGLIRHTKVAVLYAAALIDNVSCYDFNVLAKDCIIASLILHDSVKNGWNGSRYTIPKHPLEAATLIQKIGKQLKIDNVLLNVISGCVASHMGQWNTSKSGKEILPKPKTEMEKFVHMCDFLSASKLNNIKEEE